MTFELGDMQNSMASKTASFILECLSLFKCQENLEGCSLLFTQKLR